MSYTKVFSSILTSTIWLEDSDTRVVWITMLAIANREGIVEASVPGLARLAGVSLKATEEALEKFMLPDRASRNSEHEGRRIEPCQGGWQILNYDFYRFRESRQDAALRAKRYRERHAASRSVTRSNPKSRIAEAEAERDGIVSSKSNSKETLSVVDTSCTARLENSVLVPVAISLPLNDKSEFPITKTQVAEWRELFPCVDVPQALREIRAWNLAHPDRRKTKRGILSHVTHWLGKEQNRGGKGNGRTTRLNAIEAVRDSRRMPDFGPSALPAQKPVGH